VNINVSTSIHAYFFVLFSLCQLTKANVFVTRNEPPIIQNVLDCVWNVVAHAQKPVFVFRRNGRVHLNWRGRHFSRLLAAEMCASAVVMLDAPCSEVVWRVLATHSIRQFPLHFPSRACAITFQLDSTVRLERYVYSPYTLASLQASSLCWLISKALGYSVMSGELCVYFKPYLSEFCLMINY